MTSTNEISDAQIEQLRDEADTAGDRDMAVLCKRALQGNLESRGICAHVVADAAAQDDGEVM